MLVGQHNLERFRGSPFATATMEGYRAGFVAATVMTAACMLTIVSIIVHALVYGDQPSAERQREAPPSASASSVKRKQ